MDTKQPETQLEYWEIIESLGGFTWRMNHDLADGRITDPTGGIDADIAKARNMQKQLVAELEQKFGVIPPDKYQVLPGQTLEPAPAGKIYYWDWYENMKKEYYRREYDGLICSACPLSEGLDRMVMLGGVVPCGPWSGMIYRLIPPHKCAMLQHWSTGELVLKIIEAGGVPALAAFKAKEERIEVAWREKIAEESS